MNDFETRFDPAPIVENTSKISIHPSRWSKMRFRKRDRAKKNLRFHEKKGVTRVNEFSFATKRWPRVESRRQAPLRAACSTRAPFRGAATRKNVNEEEEKMEYEERRSESVTFLDLSIGRFGNFSRGKTFDDETNTSAIFISKAENKLKFYVRYSCIILENLIY